MEVRYYLDPDSGEPHIHEHGVTEEEVESLLRYPDEDLPAKDGARQALGQAASGRYLRVIYIPDPDPDSLFVVTAFELRGKPLQAFRRRRRRRRK
jgi:Domain of unknown function (DUF4258)